MRKISVHFVITILCMTLFVSCKKFLDKKPDAKLAVPSTVSDLQALLDFTFYMNLQTTPSFPEASSDDYFLSDDVYNSLSQEDQRIYLWNRGDYNFQNDWSIGYQPIYNANFCLEAIEEISVTDANRNALNNVKGSALFFRAYNFLNLSWAYSKAYDQQQAATDLGIVLRLSSDFNIPSRRATVAQCYQQIVQDAMAAATYLPELPLHVMRPSKSAAYGLLARTYLSMRLYDSAFRYANLTLQLKDDLLDYNTIPVLNDVPFGPFNKEIIFYTEMNTSVALQATWSGKIDSSLYATYDNDDLRKQAFYLPNGGSYQFKGSYTGNSDPFFSGIATDELFLIRAECWARMDQVAEAMNDLNTLLIKRWKASVPYPAVSAMNKDEAIIKILAERRKELLMRGLRWMDIKRLNKENPSIPLFRRVNGQLYTLEPNSRYYALPLPKDIIEQTGIQQN